MNDLTLGWLFLLFAMLGGIGLIAYRYNMMIKLRSSSYQAYANIAVSLLKRKDLIPELTLLAEKMVHQESLIQKALTTLRQASTTSLTEKPQDEGALNRQVQRVNQATYMMEGLMRGVAEDYPELKSSALFLSLQENISQIEQEIAYRAVYFNDYATLYNAMIGTFPNLILAKLTGLKRLNYLHTSVI